MILTAQRNIYGASRLDADVERFRIADNAFSAQSPVNGVRLSFEQIAHDPPYVARMANGVIEGNRFVGVSKPVVFAPRHGVTPRVCENVSVRLNIIDNSPASIVHMAGNPDQYGDILVADNVTPSNVSSRSGTGIS